MGEIQNRNLQNSPPPEHPSNLTYVPKPLRPRLLSQVQTRFQKSWDTVQIVNKKGIQ